MGRLRLCVCVEQEQLHSAPELSPVLSTGKYNLSFKSGLVIRCLQIGNLDGGTQQLKGRLATGPFVVPTEDCLHCHDIIGSNSTVERDAKGTYTLTHSIGDLYVSDLTSGLIALNEALPAYEEAKTYYDGLSDEKFQSAALAKQLGSNSNTFSFNYSRLVVSSRLDRMEIASIVTEDGSADELLNDIYNRNQLDLEIQDALEASLVFGDAYLIAGDSEDGVDIFYNDPLTTRAFYDVENPRKMAYAIKRWLVGEKLRVNLYYSDRVEKYISKGKPTSSMKDGDFEAFYDEDSDAWPIVNETGRIPVFHLRTGRMYGTPEHKQAYGPQNSINKLLNTQISSIDFASAPQRYFLEDPAANDGVDPIADFGGGVVDDDDVEVTSNLKAGAGGVWSLKGIKEVGQFEVADPNTFVLPFKTFIESMGTVTKTPLHAFNVGSLPSGESLRAAEAPLNKRVASLETLFGGVIADLHEFALELSGIDAKVLVKWAPVASYDDADIWGVVSAKVDAGVPLRVALMEAGYTDEQVEEWYPEGVQTFTPSQLDTLGTAIQKIAAGVTLGLLTAEEARALLPQDILFEQPVADPATVLDAIEG